MIAHLFSPVYFHDVSKLLWYVSIIPHIGYAFRPLWSFVPHLEVGYVMLDNGQKVSWQAPLHRNGSILKRLEGVVLDVAVAGIQQTLKWLETRCPCWIEDHLVIFEVGDVGDGNTDPMRCINLVESTTDRVSPWFLRSVLWLFGMCWPQFWKDWGDTCHESLQGFRCPTTRRESASDA